MKRVLPISLAAIMVLAALLPAFALAKGPEDKGQGKPPAKERVGRGKPADTPRGPKEKNAQTGRPADKPMPEGAVKAQERKAERLRARAESEMASAEPSKTPGPSSIAKKRGIENALSRIERNLARMQLRVDAGEREALPTGLLAVVQKFMMWLNPPSTTPAVVAPPTETSPTPLPMEPNPNL